MLKNKIKKLIFRKPLNLYLKCKKIKVTGTVKAGWGASSRQKHIYSERIRQKIGVELYPGTLNLNVDKELHLRNGLIIKTRVGHYVLFPIKINGVAAYAVKPPRAKNLPNTLEIMSQVSLRNEFSLKNGDFVKIELKSFYISNFIIHCNPIERDFYNYLPLLLKKFLSGKLI